MRASVLFDVPGPKARRLSRILSIVATVLILGALAAAVAALAAPRVSSGLTLPGSFDKSRWDIFADPRVWRDIGRGLLRTLQAAGVAAVLALAVGVIFATLRTSSSALVRVPATVVLEFVRGMPVLLLMLFILLAGSMDAFWAVVIALGFYNGAIIGEALRAGLGSLPRGQREAGLSIGLTRFQTRRYIEFPQAFRQMLPIILAQLVVLLKDTSLGYIVGYSELTRTIMTYMSSFYGNRYVLSLFLVALAIYLIINLTLSAVARRITRR